MPEEGEPWQAEPARRMVRYPVDRLSDWSIELVSTAVGEVREGSTWLRARRIVVYVRPDWSPARVANALAHELGHVHDVLYLDARLRDEFMRQRGLN